MLFRSPITFVIEDIAFQESDPLISGEVGIFDGTICVGVEIWDGNVPFDITVWQGDENQGLDGYTPGNPVSFYFYSNNGDENNVYNVEASSPFSGGTFWSGSLSVVELSTDFGCTNTVACNYASDAFIDDRGCWYSVDGCDCENGEGAALDECGVCNGPGSVYECVCADIPEGDCYCNGNVNAVCGVCKLGRAHV